MVTGWALSDAVGGDASSWCGCNDSVGMDNIESSIPKRSATSSMAMAASSSARLAVSASRRVSRSRLSSPKRDRSSVVGHITCPDARVLMAVLMASLPSPATSSINSFTTKVSPLRPGAQQGRAACPRWVHVSRDSGALVPIVRGTRRVMKSDASTGSPHVCVDRPSVQSRLAMPRPT